MVIDYEDRFLRGLAGKKPPAKSQAPVNRDPDTGAILLGKYQISLDMWKTWATAAGLPGASWEDSAAYQRVASYAARTMYEQFQNWGLVAIGWRYGPGVAKQFQELYGQTPASSVIETALGKAGARFVDSVLKRMYAVKGTPDSPPPQSFPAPGGIDLQFVPEEGETEPEQRQQATARQALTRVLSAMADKAAGGRRMHIDDLEAQIVPTETPGGEEPQMSPVRPISEEDNANG